jgi:hypothetical protein
VQNYQAKNLTMRGGCNSNTINEIFLYSLKMRYYQSASKMELFDKKFLEEWEVEKRKKKEKENSTLINTMT